MKKILFILFAILQFSLSGQTWEWAKSTSGFLQSGHNFFKTVITDDNNIYLAGTFKDSCRVGTMLFTGSDTAWNVLLLKMDPSGNYVWHKTFSAYWISLADMVVDGNSVAVGLNFYQILFGGLSDTLAHEGFSIASFSASGALLHHSKTVSDTWIGLEDLEMTADHQLLATVTYTGNAQIAGSVLPFEPTDMRGYMIRLDATGVPDLVKTFSSNNYYAIYGSFNIIHSDPYNNIYLLVFFTDTIHVDGDTSFYMGSSWGYTQQIIRLSSTGHLENIEAVSSYYDNTEDFYPSGNKDHFVKINLDGSCNHCTSGLILARNNYDGSLSWGYNYGGGYVSGAPFEPPATMMYPGGFAGNEDELFYAATFQKVEVNGDSLPYRGFLIAKLDHEGNYQYLYQEENTLSPWQLSNYKNGSILLTTANYSGSAHLAGFVLDSVSSLQAIIAKFSEPTASIESVMEKDINAMIVYPNPSSGKFRIDIRESLEGCTCTITDLLGNKINEEIKMHTNSLDLDLNGKAKGVYFIQLQSEKTKYVKRIVIN
jgi:hypothetical protein